MQQTEHEKAFTLKAAVDPLTLKILKARNDALEDPYLSDGARMYFCWLLDAALNNERWYFKGAVKASMLYLRSKLHRCERSFYTWNKELVDRRYIWISHLPGKNTHFFNLYHIEALHGKKVGEMQPHEDMFGNGRHHPGFASQPARGDKGKFAKTGEGANFAGCAAVENGQNPPILSSVAGANGRDLQVSPAKVTIASRKRLRLRAARLRGSQRQGLAAGNGKDLQPTAAESCGHEPQGFADNKEAELGDTVIKDTSKAYSKGLKRAVGREVTPQGFVDAMIDLTTEVFGPKAAILDARNFGKQWRSSFKQDPDIAWRAYLDVKSDAKERKIVKSVGATWRKRWFEFGGTDDRLAAAGEAVGK